MSDPRHERLSALFLQAVELGSDERAAFLEASCADEPEMRTRIEDMLRHEEATPGLFRAGIVIFEPE